MNRQSLNVIAAAGISLVTSLAHAEVIATKPNTSFTEAPQSKVIASCVKSIENYHRKEVRLFLNKSGQFKSGVDRTFSIHGWVWKDGERVRADHDCTVNNQGKGLLLTVNYADAATMAASATTEQKPKS